MKKIILAAIMITTPAPCWACATALDGHAHTPPNQPTPAYPDYDYHWEVLDFSQAAPGYWSMYSNGLRFFHHFHQCTEYGAGCGY
jgi:hypothetical protein